MTHVSSPIVRAFRVSTFAVTAYYFCLLFFTTDHDAFGWQFRFLTVWGLTASTVSAWFMLRLAYGFSDNRHEVWASVTVVLNATVVLMYWKIYFTDPALFYGADGGPESLHQEYFLHAFGPALQMIDAFFILGVFTKLRGTVIGVLTLPLAYIAWAELVLQPMNQTPAGSVTTGLPYLFLNNLEQPERVNFYITTVVTMLILFAGGVAFAWVLRRFISRPVSPQSL